MKLASTPEGYKFDLAIMLCGGVRPDASGEYHSTTYKHSDLFGMLGGRMRVIGGAALYQRGDARRFLVASGPSAKQTSEFGKDMPPDSHVYAKELAQKIDEIRRDPKNAHLAEPEIMIEDKSPDTAHNLIEATRITSDAHYGHVAISSSGLHIARVEALYKLVQARYPDRTYPDEVTFLSAEDVVQETYPGVYDAQIAAAHATDEAKLRMQSEAEGRQNILDGNYTLRERVVAS